MSMQLQAQVKPISVSTSGFTPVQTGLLQRKCASGNHTMLGGECVECSKEKRFGLQAKLMINKPGDIYEREADRIADQVMAAPKHTEVSGAPPRIQRFSRQSNGQMDAASASVDRVLASSGRLLEPALQQDMERRFGHDFSRVRVHSDAAAAQSAKEVNANAYTVGHDMVFGVGQFMPRLHGGQRLLAHELTHVIQQNTSTKSVQRQMITPLAAGGGYRGLMERDRGATMATGPIIYMCSKALDTSPLGRHALFRIGDSGTGNPTISLQPIDTLLADCWQGVPSRDYPSDVNANAECEATGISLPCLEREFGAYPIGHYCTLGPNSNTFVGHLAKRCGITNPDPPGWTPGIDDSPPPRGTFAPDKWDTLTGCKTKKCTSPPGPPTPPIG